MTIKWGVIGPGSIAHTFADALTVCGQGSLHAVASRNIERAERFAKQYRADVVYDSYQALIDDPHVDIIYVATPHSHHFPVAQQVLSAGKHLLLEKPLTVNAEQTRILVDLAKQNQCLFQEALWSRFMPCFAKVKTWLANNEIGQLQYISSQIGFEFSSHGPQHRLHRADLAGGSILDLGVYSVSLSQFLVGEDPIEVQAMGKINSFGVDHITVVNMRYPSGVFSQFTSTIGAQCSNTMTLHGDKGHIELPSLFWVGEGATLFRDNQIIETVSYEHQVNGFEYQLAATMENITRHQPCDPRMHHADSIAVMETLDSIRQQIRLTFGAKIERSY